MILCASAHLHTIDQPLLIVWDRLPARRSRLVREFIELSEGRIVTEHLPSCAPELNPVEYIRACWKQHELPNVCPKDYGELSRRARRALRRMQPKPPSLLVRSIRTASSRGRVALVVAEVGSNACGLAPSHSSLGDGSTNRQLPSRQPPTSAPSRS